jgi:hypothetical protein
MFLQRWSKSENDAPPARAWYPPGLAVMDTAPDSRIMLGTFGLFYAGAYGGNGNDGVARAMTDVLRTDSSMSIRDIVGQKQGYVGAVVMEPIFM